MKKTYEMIPYSSIAYFVIGLHIRLLMWWFLGRKAFCGKRHDNISIALVVQTSSNS